MENTSSSAIAPGLVLRARSSRAAMQTSRRLDMLEKIPCLPPTGSPSPPGSPPRRRSRRAAPLQLLHVRTHSILINLPTYPLPSSHPVRVDSEEALQEGGAAAVAAAVNALVRVQQDAAAAGGDPPLMDPVGDLKLNSLGGCRLKIKLGISPS